MSNHTKEKLILDVSNFGVTYNGRIIVRDINLQIHDIRRPAITTDNGEVHLVTGQKLGLLGPSGSGKSTIFRHLAGFESPKIGSIKVGVNLGAVSPGDVGVVFQEYILFDYMTVFENLLEGALQSGLKKATAIEYAERMLKDFGLEGQRDLYPVQVSGGQRQRTAIAQQVLRACQSPDGFLLLMDEPFSGLSPELTEQACKIINAVTNMHEYNTSIIVTHDVSAAVAVCDNIVLLGREEGKPGYTIVEVYDLAAMELAWHPDILNLPQAQALISQIKARFRTL